MLRVSSEKGLREALFETEKRKEGSSPPPRGSLFPKGVIGAHLIIVVVRTRPSSQKRESCWGSWGNEGCVFMKGVKGEVVGQEPTKKK